MRRIIRFAPAKRYKALILSLVLSFAGTFFGLAAPIVHANDCDDNAIIYCGFTRKSDFIDKVKSNKSGNGHTDLTNVYAAYGLSQADYDNFLKYGQPGTAYKDGRIVVGGKTVATDVNSIGRQASKQGSGYFSRVINGVTYYGNSNEQAFASSSLPVTVLMDGRGQVKFAVIDSCGNPIGTPSYSCNALHVSAVSGRPGTYTFTSDVSANSTAKLVKLVYTFGDGSASQTTTNPSTPVTHTYTSSGSVTARVTAYIQEFNNPIVAITSADCAKTFTVTLPFFQCLQLDANTINNSKFQYKFVVTAKVGNGAQLKGADFNFGDGKSGSGTPSGSTVTVTHSYDKGGARTVTATLRVDVPGRGTIAVGSPNCTKKVPVAIPFFNCIQLTGSILDQSKFKYQFVAQSDFGNGASLKTVDFDFGDKTSKKGVKPQGKNATADHTYAAAGNYTITATLHFSIGSGVQSVKCIAGVTPTTPPTPECKPGVPQGSALCSPCSTNPTLPSNSPECVQVLPNTGAGDVIAVTGVAAVLGFFFWRQFIYKRHVVQTDGAAVAGTHHGSTPHEEDDTLVHQVVTHDHRNHKALDHHPAYHRPHRFRPENKHDDEE